MDENIMKRRQDSRDSILGSWESEVLFEYDTKKEYKLKFTFDDKMHLTDEPIVINANKTYSDNGSSESITLYFIWINDYLISGYFDFKGGIFPKIMNKELELYKNFDVKAENLLLKFRKI